MSRISKANELYNMKKYEQAYSLYLALASEDNSLGRSLSANITLCEKKLRISADDLMNSLKRSINNISYIKSNISDFKLKKVAIEKRLEKSTDRFTGWVTVGKGNEHTWYLHLLHENDLVGSYKMEKRIDVSNAKGGLGIGFDIHIPNRYCDGNTRRFDFIIADENKNGELIFTVDHAHNTTWKRKVKGEKQLLLMMSHNFKIQGAQTSLLQLAMGLKKQYEILVVSPSSGPIQEEYYYNQIETIVDDTIALRECSFNQWVRSIEIIAERVESLRPTVVVANTLMSANLAIASKAVNIPTLLIPRESESPDLYYNKYNFMIRRYLDKLNNIVDKTIFVADATSNLWDITRTRYRNTIHNGLIEESLVTKIANINSIESRIKYGYKPDEVIYLSVGTVAERKNQIETVDAFEHLMRKNKINARLVIIGITTNDYSNLLIDKVKKLPHSIGSKVNLINETKGAADSIVQEHYVMSDIFIMSSVHESYPRVVLEALFFKLPVISTKCFGVVEQIEDNISGIFYESGDFVDLANKMYSMSNHENLWEFSNNAGLQYKRLTNYEQMIDGYTKELMELHNG